MKIFLAIMMILSGPSCYSQFVIGSTGITVKNGTLLSVNGLTLTPGASGLILVSNTLTLNATPVPGSPNGSIKRVYSFTSPVAFSGVAGMFYQTGELNNSSENTLQIIYSADGVAFAKTTGSQVGLANHYVSNTIASPNLRALSAIGNNNNLSVTLVDFSVRAEAQTALLQWTTSYETNADYFGIEYSTDLKSWQELERVRSAGESTGSNHYHYAHAGVVSGSNYYRLKMVDQDGTFAMSAIRSVDFKVAEDVIVFLNPVADRLQFKNTSAIKVTDAAIYDASGRLLYQNKSVPEKGIEVGTLTSGSYVLRLERENGTNSSHAFFKH